MQYSNIYDFKKGEPIGFDAIRFKYMCKHWLEDDEYELDQTGLFNNHINDPVIGIDSHEGELYLCFDSIMSSKTYYMIPESELISKGVVKERYVPVVVKNTTVVHGSKEELLAFEEVLKSKGVKDNSVWNKGFRDSNLAYYVLVYGEREHLVSYRNTYQYHTHNCSSNTDKLFNLPYQQQEAINYMFDIKEEVKSMSKKQLFTVEGSIPLKKALVEELVEEGLIAYPDVHTYGNLVPSEGSSKYQIHGGGVADTNYTLPLQYEEAKQAFIEYYKEEEVFKVGDWVYAERQRDEDYREVSSNAASYIPTFRVEETQPYAFGEGVWLRPEKGQSNGVLSKYCRRATKEEVEKALIAEATKRYPHASKYVAVRDTTTEDLGANGTVYKSYGVKAKRGSEFIYNPVTDTLTNWGYGLFVIYEQGKWAEILPSTPDIRIQGYVAKFNGDTVSFGCQTLSKEFVQQLNSLVNGYEVDFSSYSKELKEINDYLNK